MNGRTSKLLRKVAKTIGKDPQYIKRSYKAMTPFQQAAYKQFVKSSLTILQSRKEVQDGENLPELRTTNSPEK